VPISHHFHDCTALLVWRFVVVKWRYIKYEAFYIDFLFPVASRQGGEYSGEQFCMYVHVCARE